MTWHPKSQSVVWLKFEWAILLYEIDAIEEEGSFPTGLPQLKILPISCAELPFIASWLRSNIWQPNAALGAPAASSAPVQPITADKLAVAFWRNMPRPCSAAAAGADSSPGCASGSQASSRPSQTAGGQQVTWLHIHRTMSPSMDTLKAKPKKQNSCHSDARWQRH